MPDKRKHERSNKSQLGQFITPINLATKLFDGLQIVRESRVLEPGCGNGSFILPAIDRLLKAYYWMPKEEALAHILTHNLWGVEIDPEAYNNLLDNIRCTFGCLPKRHNLYQEDFLQFKPDLKFDFVIGNPPFGGTIAIENQDKLDKMYGWRNGNKIKKETYSFFLVKSLDHLEKGGRLKFICSDTFLTIPTMKGLREYLMNNGTASIKRLKRFSDETSYPMIVLDYRKTCRQAMEMRLDHKIIKYKNMMLTQNFSWTITDKDAKYFQGPTIASRCVCTDGMVTGKDKYFVRKIANEAILEPYEFEFYEEPISLKRELERARHNKLSEKRKQEIAALESAGATRRNVRISKRKEPVRIELPHPDYKYHNKASKDRFFADPKWVIYWKDEGDAVKTFKMNGNWYLRGIGGAPYFEHEGFTWSKVSSELRVRYLPAGYILDSGAPCGFLHKTSLDDELDFIIGWLNTPLANRLLKTYVNHTKNIQGKDIERMPYPFWVSENDKQSVTSVIRDMRRGTGIHNEANRQAWLDSYIHVLSDLCSY